MKKCKCGVVCTPENTSKTYLKRKSPICKACVKAKYNDKNNANSREERKARILKQDLIQTELISVDVPGNFKEQYISSKTRVLGDGLYAIRSALGTGKTQVAIDVIKSNPTKSIVYVSPQVISLDQAVDSFARAGIRSQRYDGIKISQFEINQCKNGTVYVTTPDSYWLIDGKPDILIIDEAYTIFSDIVEKSNILDSLSQKRLLDGFTKMRHQKSVVLLDAFLPEKLLGLFDLEVHKESNTFKKNKHIRYYESQDFLRERFMNKIVKEVLEHPDERFLIQADTVPFLKTVQRLLLGCGVNTEVYSKDNRPPKDETQYPRVMLVSPVMKVGVSVLGVERVFLFTSGKSVGPYGVFQMLDRARESTIIEIAATKGFDLGEILFEEYAKAADFDKMVDFIAELRRFRTENLAYLRALIGNNYNVKSDRTLSGKIRNYMNNPDNINLESVNRLKETLIDEGFHEESIVKEFKKSQGLKMIQAA